MVRERVLFKFAFIWKTQILTTLAVLSADQVTEKSLFSSLKLGIGSSSTPYLDTGGARPQIQLTSESSIFNVQRKLYLFLISCTDTVIYSLSGWTYERVSVQMSSYCTGITGSSELLHSPPKVPAFPLSWGSMISWR